MKFIDLLEEESILIGVEVTRTARIAIHTPESCEYNNICPTEGKAPEEKFTIYLLNHEAEDINVCNELLDIPTESFSNTSIEQAVRRCLDKINMMVQANGEATLYSVDSEETDVTLRELIDVEEFVSSLDTDDLYKRAKHNIFGGH